MAFVDSPADRQGGKYQGYQFFKVFDDHQFQNMLFLQKVILMMCIWLVSWQRSKSVIFWLHTKRV